jgi:predicted N-acetyltransferase YhbS
VSALVRLARASDLPDLAEVERDAARRFAPWGLDRLFASALTPPHVHEEAIARGDLFVASVADRAVGFALCSRVDWHMNLDELDVAVDFGRRGLGTALVTRVLDHARSFGLSRVTLATMREVPWNAPWYARLGFRPMLEEEFGPGMRTVFACELAAGFPTRERVFMVKEL